MEKMFPKIVIRLSSVAWSDPLQKQDFPTDVKNPQKDKSGDRHNSLCFDNWSNVDITLHGITQLAATASTTYLIKGACHLKKINKIKKNKNWSCEIKKQAQAIQLA